MESCNMKMVYTSWGQLVFSIEIGKDLSDEKLAVYRATQIMRIASLCGGITLTEIKA